MRQLLVERRVQSGHIFVDVCKQHLPPDILLQEQVRVLHNCIRIVLALRKRQRIQQKARGCKRGWGAMYS